MPTRYGRIVGKRERVVSTTSYQGPAGDLKGCRLPEPDPRSRAPLVAKMSVTHRVLRSYRPKLCGLGPSCAGPSRTKLAHATPVAT